MKGDTHQKLGEGNRYRRTGFIFLALAIFALAAYLFYPFLSAILWAAIFSVLMFPFYRKMRKRFSESVSAALATFATLGVIVLPICILGLVVYAQLASAVREVDLASSSDTKVTSAQILTKLDDTIYPALKNVGIEFHLRPWFEENRQQIVQSVSGPLTKFAVTAGHTMLNFAVALVTMFFMLKGGHKLREPVLELIPLKREETGKILERIGATIRAVFVGVVLVSLIQGFMCGIAYVCLGVPSPILWGILTMVICMIPLLGAPAGYVPVALYLFVDGRWVQGVILLVIGFGVISNVDNFVRPLVIGNRTELPYIAIFFGLLGGVFAFGAVGIVAGPVIIAVSMSLIQIWRERLTASEREPAAA